MTDNSNMKIIKSFVLDTTKDQVLMDNTTWEGGLVELPVLQYGQQAFWIDASLSENITDVLGSLDPFNHNIVSDYIFLNHVNVNTEEFVINELLALKIVMETHSIYERSTVDTESKYFVNNFGVED